MYIPIRSSTTARFSTRLHIIRERIRFRFYATTTIVPLFRKGIYPLSTIQSPLYYRNGPALPRFLTLIPSSSSASSSLLIRKRYAFMFHPTTPFVFRRFYTSSSSLVSPSSTFPHTDRWLRMRLSWLATGQFTDITIIPKASGNTVNNTEGGEGKFVASSSSSSLPDEIPTSLFTVPDTVTTTSTTTTLISKTDTFSSPLLSSSSSSSPASPEITKFLIRIAELRHQIHHSTMNNNRKPLRINELNILNALRDSNRYIEFNRNLPLSNMIRIINALWEQEGLHNNSNINSAVTTPIANNINNNTISSFPVSFTTGTSNSSASAYPIPDSSSSIIPPPSSSFPPPPHHRSRTSTARRK